MLTIDPLKQGNSYDHRVSDSGEHSYHYSNRYAAALLCHVFLLSDYICGSDGSYYYSNSDGSTYYNSGDGYSNYTSPSGDSYQSYSSSK